MNEDVRDLAVIHEMPPVKLERPTKDVMDEAVEASIALMEYVEAGGDGVTYKNIGGKKHLMVESWQTIGKYYGLVAKPRDAKAVQYGDVKGFEATADIFHVASGQVVSSAQSMCLDDEANWKGKPAFQLMSMAQTRACGKAFRNVLAWVVVLAGYKPTPAEEMTGNEHSGDSSSGKTDGIEARTASKFDNAKCHFCGKKHVNKGEEIVLVGGKWGAEACLNKKPAETVDKGTGEVQDKPEGADVADRELLADWIAEFAKTYPDITEQVTGQKDHRYDNKTFLMTFGLGWMNGKQALLQKALDKHNAGEQK